MQVYAELFPGVQVDFCLNVRKSDWPPQRIADEVSYLSAALTCLATQLSHMPMQQSTMREQCRRPLEVYPARACTCACPLQDPELFTELQQAVRDLEGIQPYTPAVQEALKLFYDFETSQASSVRLELICRGVHHSDDCQVCYIQGCQHAGVRLLPCRQCAPAQHLSRTGHLADFCAVPPVHLLHSSARPACHPPRACSWAMPLPQRASCRPCSSAVSGTAWPVCAGRGCQAANWWRLPLALQRLPATQRLQSPSWCRPSTSGHR